MRKNPETSDGYDGNLIADPQLTSHLGLPLIVALSSFPRAHGKSVRYAEADTQRIIKDAMRKRRGTGVLHCEEYDAVNGRRTFGVVGRDFGSYAVTVRRNGSKVLGIRVVE